MCTAYNDQIARAASHSLLDLYDLDKSARDRRKAEEAARRSDEFQAKEAAADAAYARYYAGFLRKEGESAAAEELRKAGLSVGEARNALSASGMDVNVGSPAALAATIRASGEYDALVMRRRAEIEAMKQEYQARAYDRTFDYHIRESMAPLTRTSTFDVLRSVTGNLMGVFGF